MGCRKCGCTEELACIEFDAEGYAHPCYWASADTCSACVHGVYEPPPGSSLETERARRVRVSSSSRRALRVPALAGTVARPR